MTLTTLQFAWGGLLDSKAVGDIHLVAPSERGGYGPILCGIDRFAEDSPGFSIGGGLSGPGGDVTCFSPCTGCSELARSEYPEHGIHGMFREVFR